MSQLRRYRLWKTLIPARLLCPEDLFAMITNIMIPAAQYLRMSTEDQPNSIPTQRDGIQRYAAGLRHDHLRHHPDVFTFARVKLPRAREIGCLDRGCRHRG